MVYTCGVTSFIFRMNTTNVLVFSLGCPWFKVVQVTLITGKEEIEVKNAVEKVLTIGNVYDIAH